jgi:predicted thioesterase
MAVASYMEEMAYKLADWYLKGDKGGISYE